MQHMAEAAIAKCEDFWRQLVQPSSYYTAIQPRSPFSNSSGNDKIKNNVFGFGAASLEASHCMLLY